VDYDAGGAKEKLLHESQYKDFDMVVLSLQHFMMQTCVEPIV
jgi:hypothetical protein